MSTNGIKGEKFIFLVAIFILFCLPVHSNPLRQARFDYQLKELHKMLEDINTRKEGEERIKRMDQLVSSKYGNSVALYKKGDKIGACRDMRIAYELNWRAGMADLALYSNYNDSHARGVDPLKSKLSSMRQELGEVMQHLMTNYFCN
jgi:hypothetical protein